MNTLNVKPIFKNCLKFTKDVDLAWSCVSQAWLSADKDGSVEQIASYMYSKSIHLAKNEYKHRKKYVVMSNLCHTDKEGKELNYIDTIENNEELTAKNDTDIIVEFVSTLPKNLKKAGLLLLNGIFEGKINKLGNQTLKPETIRVYLHNLGFISENLSKVANELYTHLISYYSNK